MKIKNYPQPYHVQSLNHWQMKTIPISIVLEAPIHMQSQPYKTGTSLQSAKYQDTSTSQQAKRPQLEAMF